ncbi:sporulation protein YabP [Clostridium sp. MB40-C1]|uniref:sporulation protein YabP n=1 Tax=Clostridium sp. MB40-C1 TaxID=3070996 RepID=UPI0027E17C0C|nr:sporulation protein YabP [Clostridium sp. MB40-C1]WMJ80262.1 sporulation protein YabP [Clostridium sp. MB40-C1]
METKKESGEGKKSNLTLEDRKRMVLSGVLEVISFDDKCIALDTTLGTLTVKGQELKMNKLDVQNGDIIILGQINSCVYTTTESKKDKESIIARLFR